MRVSQLLAAATCATTALASIPGGNGGDLTYPHLSAEVQTTLEPETQSGDMSTVMQSDIAASLSTVPVTLSGSQTSPLTTSAQTSTLQSTSKTNDSKPPADSTGSQPADATGGAILQQTQGSMAGLLGFCIMSLIML